MNFHFISLKGKYFNIKLKYLFFSEFQNLEQSGSNLKIYNNSQHSFKSSFYLTSQFLLCSSLSHCSAPLWVMVAQVILLKPIILLCVDNESKLDASCSHCFRSYIFPVEAIFKSIPFSWTEKLKLCFKK